MEKNIIEKYELIDGHAVIDCNYNIVTANEDMYKFIGISKQISLVESIHQVDLDDFFDVTRNLRTGNEADMVIRMRRADNSYRWMTIHISKFMHSNNGVKFEYWELNISDILALKKRNKILQNSMLNLRHLLAMENELVFTYDYETNIYQVSNFIDNDFHSIITVDIDELYEKVLEEGLISEDSRDSFKEYYEDLKKGTLSHTHVFKSNFITKKKEFDNIEFKTSTIYNGNNPKVAVGSVKNLTTDQAYMSIRTVDSEDSVNVSYEGINKFCINNIMYNPESEFALILVELDNYDSFLETLGEEKVEIINRASLGTAKHLTGYRGTVCQISGHQMCLAVKDINDDTYLRAFLESLRNQISWNLKLTGLDENVSFSMGISRYPQNGNDIGVIHQKLFKALDIAHERGKGKYIIYREHLHGEI